MTRDAIVDEAVALAMTGYGLQPLRLFAENGGVPGATRTATGWSFSRECLAGFGKAIRANRGARGYVELDRINAGKHGSRS